MQRQAHQTFYGCVFGSPRWFQALLDSNQKTDTCCFKASKHLYSDLFPQIFPC